MGTADRDYFRDEAARYARGRRPALPPVIKWLIISNVVVFLIDFVTRPGPILPELGSINTMFCFSIQSAFLEGRVWELLTFQFLHGGFLHIIFNCIGLYFFGPWVERWWGSRRFLVFYLLCGVAGALFFTLLTLVGILPGSGLVTPLIGASAGLYGILVAAALINPNQLVRLLFPPVELTVRRLALIVLGIAVVIILGDNLVGGRPFQNSGGEAGHLGGAILGWLLTRHPALLRKGTGRKIIRPREFRRKRRDAKLRPRTEVDVSSDSEVDRILEKISREGLQSLTEVERVTLQRAAKSYDES